MGSGDTSGGDGKGEGTGDDKPPRRSMKTFDYFTVGQKPLSPEALAKQAALPEVIAEEAQERLRRLSRARRAAFLSTLAFVACAYFIYDTRDLIAYAFSPPRKPQVLGDTAEIRPEHVPHNSYVEVQGITEHRLLQRRLVRGFLPKREDFAYFRLLGSRGVFIEVPPDPALYDVTSEVRVAGRAVDPQRSRVYTLLLEEYVRQFNTRPLSAARIIQVGFVPGEGRGPYYVLFLVMAALATMQGWTVSRYLRLRKAGSGVVK